MSKKKKETVKEVKEITPQNFKEQFKLKMDEIIKKYSK
jgi:hypothetical protein